MVLVTDKNGKKGLISIETKYTDLLGKNTSTDSKTKNDLIENGGFFTEELKQELKTKGYKQIHRNFLLTYAYAIKHKIENYANVILSPNEDKHSQVEITEMQQNMTKYKNSILKISLQDFVERGTKCGNSSIENIMAKFYKRYLAY